MEPDGIEYLDEGDVFHDDVFYDDVVGGFGEPMTGGGFESVFGLFVVVFIVVVIAGIAMSVRRAKKLHDAGIDPLDPETDLQVRWAQSRTMSPAGPTQTAGRAPATGAPPSGSEPVKTVEERLAEVDRLYAAGAITPSERDAARARILGTI
jgi:hypothetical protein